MAFGHMRVGDTYCRLIPQTYRDGSGNRSVGGAGVETWSKLFEAQVGQQGSFLERHRMGWLSGKEGLALLLAGSRHFVSSWYKWATRQGGAGWVS